MISDFSQRNLSRATEHSEQHTFEINSVKLIFIHNLGDEHDHLLWVRLNVKKGKQLNKPTKIPTASFLIALTVVCGALGGFSFSFGRCCACSIADHYSYIEIRRQQKMTSTMYTDWRLLERDWAATDRESGKNINNLHCRHCAVTRRRQRKIFAICVIHVSVTNIETA